MITEPGIDDAVLRESAKPDPVTAPKHYAGDGFVDCKRAMKSMHAGWDLAHFANESDLFFYVSCAFKYIWRFPLKDSEDGGLQDLKKARECLDIAIKEWDRAPF